MKLVGPHEKITSDMPEPKTVAEVIEYLERNEWQLKVLSPGDSVRVSAHILASALHHLRELAVRQSCDKRDGA